MVSFFHEEFDVWLSKVRLNEFESSNMSEDRLRDKGRSLHATNKTNKLKICVIMYIWPRSRENLLLNTSWPVNNCFLV